MYALVVVLQIKNRLELETKRQKDPIGGLTHNQIYTIN